jgi:hypothetical protein
MRYRALAVLAALAGLGTPGLCAGAWGAAERAGATPVINPAALTLTADPAPATANAPAVPAAAAAAPLHLAMLADEPESIYPTPNLERPREQEGINAGGVNFHLTINYMTDYVYRGVDHSEVGNAAEDAPNLQFDGYLTFDLGRLPHPVVGVFVNVFNDDPISRFQEIRPYVGFDWNYRPLTFSAGWISYIFPEREGMNTQEIYGRLALDDAFLFHSSTPLLTPYVYAAYDYQKYDGVYLEAGVKHDFKVPDTGIVLTAVADLGYVANQRFFTLRNGKDTGFQHYDIGMIGTYSLNTLFNLPMRYGEWKLKGYLYYTDGLNNDLRADTQIWGGMGISFDY